MELKRAKRLCKLLELQDQGQTYVDKLKKILLGQGQSSPDIEVVFVLGRPIQGTGRQSRAGEEFAGGSISRVVG